VIRDSARHHNQILTFEIHYHSRREIILREVSNSSLSFSLFSKPFSLLLLLIMHCCIGYVSEEWEKGHTSLVVVLWWLREQGQLVCGGWFLTDQHEWWCFCDDCVRSDGGTVDNALLYWICQWDVRERPYGFGGGSVMIAWARATSVWWLFDGWFVTDRQEWWWRCGWLVEKG
jgi:hypothetical protein